MNEFDEFDAVCRKSMELCPWSSSQTLESYAKEIMNETEEFLAEVAVDDVEKMKDELGDILVDWMHVALLLEKKGVGINDVISGAKHKLERRKPFLEKGETVSYDEAKKIWREVKKRENGDS